MAYNLRAKKPTPKVNKSGFSGPDSRYKPPRAHEVEEDDDNYEEDYSQPEPYNYRQPTTNSSANQKQKQQQKKGNESILAGKKRYLDLNAIADTFDRGYEYVFDRGTGKYVKQLKKPKPKTVPVPVHKPVPVPEPQPQSERQPESAKKKKRKSVSEPRPEFQPGPPAQKNKTKWGSSLITLPAYFYPALTAILFGLLAAHYIGGSSYVQRTGVGSWNPNPITEVANTLESSVIHPRKVLASGVVNKERYKNFYVVVKEYCRHLTKGASAKSRYIKQNTRKKPENANPPSWVERTVERVRKVKVPQSWGEVIANVEYFWWRYGYFVRQDEYYPEYPTREASEICEDLKVYIRQAAGEDWHINLTDDLERSLTYLWPSAASSSLSHLHGLLDLWFKDRAKKAKKTGVKTVTKLKTGDKIIGAGGDGVVLVDDHPDGSRFGAPVWGLNVSVGYPIMQQVQYEFDDFKKIAEDTVERLRDMDKLLGVITTLAEELISKHQPEEWLVWTKLPEEGVNGITEVAPGWGAMSFKSLGIDESDLENAFKSAGLAQKSWGNVRKMVRDFRMLKESLERWVEGKDGKLALLEERLKEVMKEENWGRLGKVQGQQTLWWKYLEVSEDMVQDLKDKAKRVEEDWKKVKNEEMERSKKRVAEELEREKKAAEEAVPPKDRSKWLFKGGQLWYINSDGVWS